MRTTSVTVGPLAAASANNIALSQTPSAGALTINGSLASGGVATIDTPRRVLITMTGNETANTFTITGTGFTGQTQSETVAGVNNSTAQSALDYKTVTSITIASNAANALTVGTNGVASSSWVRMDEWALPQISIQAVVSGTINYTIQQTLDDPNDPTNSTAIGSVTWINHPDSNLVSATGNVQGNYGYVPRYSRVLVNSQTNPATVTVKYTQAGVNPK